ncbi:hypothetical protein GCM10010264_30500 [Streptomyces globisporus]|nr:hypothetical protein GCM10010264_30500 [Streptomyces globisporus]
MTAYGTGARHPEAVPRARSHSRTGRVRSAECAVRKEWFRSRQFATKGDGLRALCDVLGIGADIRRTRVVRGITRVVRVIRGRGAAWGRSRFAGGSRAPSRTR